MRPLWWIVVLLAAVTLAVLVSVRQTIFVLGVPAAPLVAFFLVAAAWRATGTRDPRAEIARIFE